jgi:hypothetical protein
MGWWQGPLPTHGATASTEVVTPDSPPEAVAPTSDADVSGFALEPATGQPAADGPTYAPYDGEIFGIGDSVLAGAAPCLTARGIDVDVQQSRRISQAVGLLEARADQLPERIIVHLGTNGGVTSVELDAIMEILGPDRLVLWSTIQLPDDPSRYTYERRTNDAIADLVNRYDNVLIFDWEAKSHQHPTWLYAEGIHMTPEGCKGYASLVEPQIRSGNPL